jgi:hypothetical protein
MGMTRGTIVSEREEQALVWNYFSPRHTHAWNMLVLSWRQLEQINDNTEIGFETEYHWENFILRLWLYRTTVMTLAKLDAVKSDASRIVEEFDNSFKTNGYSQLKALRDMIEHFDDYASGLGRGKAERDRDLDPFRHFTRDCYERGKFRLERKCSYSAAIKLQSGAKIVSKSFINWYTETNTV